MTDCTGLPTLQTIQDFNKDAKVLSEVVTSENDRTSQLDSLGNTHLTLTGIGTLASEQRDHFESTFIAQFAFKRIGNISDYVGQQLTDAERLNAYQYPDNSGEWYGPIQSQPFPITIPPNPSTSVTWTLVTAATKVDIARAQNEIIGGRIFPEVGDVENGMIIPVVTPVYTHLRVASQIYAMSPVASGVVSLLAETSATIGVTPVEFKSRSLMTFNTLDDAVNSLNLYIGMSLDIKERITDNGGGGNWDVVLTTSVTPNGYDIVQCINVTSLALVLRPQENKVTLKQLGFVSGVNAASGLNAITSGLYNRGVREIILDIDNLKIDSAVDFENLKLTGQNVRLTGNGFPLNYESLTGCEVQGFRPDIPNPQMPEPAQQSAKLVYRVNEDRYQVLSSSPDKDRGGVMIDVKKDVTSTPSNSIGGPAELLRMTWVHKCTGIYSWNANFSSSNGTWSQWTVPESYLRHDGDNVGRATQALQNGGGSGGVGESLTWNVTGVLGKKQNIAIAGTAAAADCDLLVDGVVVDSLSPSDWAGFVNVIEFDVPTGNHTVEIRQTSSSGTLRVLGINFSEIKDIIPGTPVDTFAFYRDPNFTHYSLSDGAHDYAIQDDDCDLWAGSFHGGETAVAQTFIIDGSIQNAPIISDGGLFSCGELQIRQRTVIDWTSAGGGLINTQSMTSFGASQIRFDCSMESPAGMYASRFYTSMMGANEEFTSLITPVNKSLVYDNGRTYLGNTNKVAWYHANTGTTLVADSNIIINHKGHSGGAEVNRIAGSYAKLYYGPVQRGRQLIKKINFSEQKTFK